MGTNLHMWDAQVALLSKSLRVVRYDCRGHGTSDVPPGPYTIEQLGHDLLTLGRFCVYSSDRACPFMSLLDF
ncbi:MAG: hypothetical protein PVSMB2_30910 [Ktedonobacteraceae bacterium]